MKSVIISILVLALIFTSVFITSNAIKIDGKEQGFEWDSAECVTVITSADSNNVDFSLIKCYLDSNGYDAYFLLYLADSVSDSLEKCGFILNLNDGVELKITSDKFVGDYNSDLFNVTSKINVVKSDGVYCEIKIAFKKGLPDSVGGTVSFIDGTGNNSYFYPFSFVYREITTTEKTTAVSAEKTTKEKVKVEKTTRASTTKQKVTEKSKTTSTKPKGNATVVYFYEKEIYVSEVYVTQVVSVSDAETTLSALATTETSQRSFQISEGVTAQKIICAVGGAVLIAFAAWSGLSAKKKPDKTSKETDQSSDSDKD